MQSILLKLPVLWLLFGGSVSRADEKPAPSQPPTKSVLILVLARVTAVDARRRIEVFSHLDVVKLDVDDLLGGIDLSWARAKPWSRAARDRACRDGSARLTP